MKTQMIRLLPNLLFLITFVTNFDLLSAGFSPAHASDQAFSVFCTSNFDSTGKCVDENNGELECIIVPGGIIACKNAREEIYECVQYGSIIANQSQFACEPDTDQSVDSNLFSKNKSDVELKDKSDNSSDRNLNTPLNQNNRSLKDSFSEDIFDDSKKPDPIDGNEFLEAY